MPEELRLFVKRVHYDEDHIAELSAAVKVFLVELSAKEQALRALANPTEAAA
jgi:hypothetical protein